MMLGNMHSIGALERMIFDMGINETRIRMLFFTEILGGGAIFWLVKEPHPGWMMIFLPIGWVAIASIFGFFMIVGIIIHEWIIRREKQ